MIDDFKKPWVVERETRCARCGELGDNCEWHITEGAWVHLHACRPKKQKKRSRLQVAKGEPLSLYAFHMLFCQYMEALRKRQHVGTGYSVFWGEKVISIAFVALHRSYADVASMIQSGEVRRVIYPEGWKCRCRNCDRARVKKPTGPRPKKGKLLTIEDFARSRSAMPSEQLAEIVRRNGERKLLTAGSPQEATVVAD